MTDYRLTPPQLNRLLATRPAAREPLNYKLNSPFYRFVAASDRIVISKFMHKKCYEAGQVIFKEGDAGDTMYIIWSGRAAVVKGNFEDPTILGYREVGDIVGEMSLLENKPRSASFVALEALSVSEIKRQGFENLLALNPSLSMNIMATLSARLRAADDARRSSAHIENKLLRRVFDLQAQNQQLLELQEALYQTGHAISDTLDLPAVLSLILEYMERVVPYDRGSVLLQIGDRLEMIASRGFPAEFVFSEVRIGIKDNDIFDEIRQTKKPLVITDVSTRPDWQHIEALSTAVSWVGVPLLHFNQVVGMISLARESYAPFREDELSLTTTFSGQAMIALANARLYDRIARFVDQLQEIAKDPSEAVQAAFAQLEVMSLLGSETIPSDVLEALSTFLFYDKLASLPAAMKIVADLKPYDSPTYSALRRLREIGAEVDTYQAATSKYQQLAALARATDRLDDLSDYITVYIDKQERTILEGIIQQWRRLVSETGGEVGATKTNAPVANPYVAGNPVTGDLFVGREDVLRRLSELWNNTGLCPSVVLYGHRRMGKTSIFHNLDRVLSRNIVIVDFNMQRVGLVANTGEMLYNLALALYDSLDPYQQEELGEPDETSFIRRNPYTWFDRFLKRLNRVRQPEQRFIITVDEFELIEQMIVEGKLQSLLLDFWRGLIQTYPWYIMAFAGLHTLREMTQDYWHPLFGSVKAIPVSFLSHEAAWRLITQPTPEFDLDYDTEAVERIINLTHGQPYLIQLIGQGLVTSFNRQVFEDGLKRQRRFTLIDVEAIINSSEFYRDGNAYFNGIWALVGSGPLGQQDILTALVEDPASTEELAEQVGLSLTQTITALKSLERHNIVQRIDGPLAGVYNRSLFSSNGFDDFLITPADLWDFTVELMRRWVAQREEILPAPVIA